MGVARLYRAASPLSIEEAKQIDYVQSFDVLYMAHLNYDPFKLSRSDHTSWAFSNVAFGPTIAAPTGVSVAVTDPNQDDANDGNAFFPQTDSYVVTAVSASGQESRVSASDDAENDLTLKRNKNTVSWSAVDGAVRYRVYKAHNGGDFGFIGATEGLSFVDDNIIADLVEGPREARTPFAEEGDKPSTVTFFEQRLWWGRTRNNPNALYGSRSADFENMDVSVPLRGDDAVTVRLVSTGVNQAHQLVPMKSLQVFSSDGIFVVEGANEDYISASPPPRQGRHSGRGSSRLSPIVIDSVAIYNSKNGEQVRAAGYSFEADGVKSNDVGIFSPDFFEGFTIVSWCYAEEPLSVIWAARSDGALLAFTWQEEHQVWGWTICPLAGDGKVRRLAAVSEQGEHRVYAIMERTIAGATRYTRERMSSAKWRGLARENHLDCSATRVFETPSNVIGGLWHLEGETVAAYADGLEFEGLVVEGGSVTLPNGYEATVCTVGLPFDVVVETLPLAFNSQDYGSSAGRAKQTGQAVLKVTRSRLPKVGVKEDRVYPLQNPSQYRDLTLESSLASGDYDVPTGALSANEATLFIKHRIGPLTVTAAYLDVQTKGT